MLYEVITGRLGDRSRLELRDHRRGAVEYGQGRRVAHEIELERVDDEALRARRA